MVSTKSSASTIAPRRSGRLAKVADAALPVADNNRVTKAQPPSKTPRYTCSTCDRELAASAFFKTRPTKRCNHEVHTCKACLKSFLTAQLESTTYDRLSCPECPEMMQHIDMKRCASKETYAKYDELERRAIQDDTPGWRWCLAPKCRAGQVHKPLLDTDKNDDEGASKAKKGGKKKKTTKANADDIFTCEMCGAKACVPCDRPYHDGETCAQYQKRAERQNGVEEEASLAKIQSECKPCPKCAKKIEKDGGCDQVACTQCGESFCWLCSISYHVINTKGHADGCIYAKPDRFDPHAAPNAPGNALAAAGGGGWNLGGFFRG